MIPPETLDIIGGAGPWVTAIGGIGTALTLTNVVSLPTADQQNIAIGTSIAILIGGIIMLAAYHFTIDKIASDPGVQEATLELMYHGLQGDPKLAELQQLYKGIPEYTFRADPLQILPQSDVLTLDKNAWRYKYKYGSWPGYDPAPYQAYDITPGYGTDPYFFDPFGLRTSDFDAQPAPFNAYPPYPNPNTILGYTYSTSV